MISTYQKLQQLASTHPTWFQAYDDASADAPNADRGALERLLATAPSEFARGVVFGKIALCDQVAVLTAR